MELILFRKNEIVPELFKNTNVLYNLVPESMNDIGQLKMDYLGNWRLLDKTKESIDNLDYHSEKLRLTAVKYLHEYELIKIICKKQVISRAYFKLYEMIYHDPIVVSESLNCFFICEAPGGFIECISDIRRKKNLRMNFLALSKDDREIKFDRYLEQNNLISMDMLNVTLVDQLINKLNGRKFNLVTSDGGFDIKQYNGQEIYSSRLLLSEIYLGLHVLETNGMFIIKFFDMFTHNSLMYYFILCSMFKYVKIIKPKTSRNCNSERYLICYYYKGMDTKIITDIKEILYNVPTDKLFIIYPNFNLGIFCDYLSKLEIFNNLIVHEQVKTITESIKMVYSKDKYLQVLILKLFQEKCSINYIKNYKNILYTRLKKCIQFLKYYDINTHQMLFI